MCRLVVFNFVIFIIEIVIYEEMLKFYVKKKEVVIRFWYIDRVINRFILYVNWLVGKGVLKYISYIILSYIWFNNIFYDRLGMFILDCKGVY